MAECGPGCKCGCKDGKPCSCKHKEKKDKGGAKTKAGDKASGCGCDPSCTCGCQKGEACQCSRAATTFACCGQVVAEGLKTLGHVCLPLGGEPKEKPAHR